MYKKVVFLLLTALMVIYTVLSCSDSQINFPNDAVTNFNALREAFKQPPENYGTIPFFVWNDKVTKESISGQMQDFKDAGCGGVIVHPRPGLITEYLSPEWFDLFGYTVDKAKELGMNVWIYDENSYPSGFAGGHVPAQMPESYNQGQGLMPVESNTLPNDYDKYFIILKEVDGKYEDITSRAIGESGRKSSYILFEKTYYPKSGWFGGYSYVDLLYPGVTEKFLELTMAGYEAQSGDEFGKTIKGVFTDEPEISSPGGFRWTPDLFDVFREHWGYDLKENLPSLYKQVGNWKKVRHNYTKTLLWLFTERWSKPAAKYFDRRGLEFTGHYWEHGWPSMRLGGDNMAMYAYHTVPGIDMLFNQFDEESPNAQFGNIRSVKELASVANQFGRTRTLSETYGGAGWEITFQDLKRLGDWEYVLGVNLMNQHLSFSTIAGARKYDYPPSFSYHNPWWKSYDYLNNYFARLSLALSSGIQQNHILVLEPTTTAWLYDSYMNEGRYELLNRIGATFQQFVTTLEKEQIEYDLGSEDIIENVGEVTVNGFKVGTRVYKTVVIPPLMENLNKKTFDLLKQFVDNGGKLIMFAKPDMINGDSPDNGSGSFNRESANLVHYERLDKVALGRLAENQDIHFREINGGNLFHHRRVLQDGQLIFLVNASLDTGTRGIFTVPGRDVLLMEPFTGDLFDYAENLEGEKVSVDFSLKPAESLMLFVSNKAMKGYPPHTIREYLKELQPSSEVIAKMDKENVLALDFCDLTMGEKQLMNIHVGEAASNVFKQHGFGEGNPWNHAVQYKNSIIERSSGFLDSGGFVITYRFTINDRFDWSEFRLVVERPELYEIAINGDIIEPNPGQWWLDKSFGVFSAGKWLNEGENKITVSCKPMKIHAEIEPLYILGDFSLVPTEKGWAIHAPREDMKKGSWKDQGFPFYSWDIIYQRHFDISLKGDYYEVGLNEWLGTVAEVFVNGNHAGTIVLPSERVPVTGLVKEGNNLVEVRITGSLKNLIGPHHNDPKPGLVSPWQWRNINVRPSGNAFQFNDYGLYGDICLYAE